MDNAIAMEAATISHTHRIPQVIVASILVHTVLGLRLVRNISEHPGSPMATGILVTRDFWGLIHRASMHAVACAQARMLREYPTNYGGF